MNNTELWNRYRQYLRIYPDVGLRLDISRMRFSDDLFSAMSGQTQRAFKEMKALEAGEIANPDEKRMVGHYWLRSPDASPNSEMAASISSAHQKIKDFATKVHSGEITSANGKIFTHLLLVGIGGSALGPQLVADAMTTADDKIRLHYCDNTDIDGIRRTLSQIGDALEQTLVIVISKSGGTVETRNGALEAASAFRAAGLKPEGNFVAITVEGSHLDKQSQEEGWLDQFYIWDWVGGRTSIFSAVGLLPAALQGVDTDQFLEGAAKMDQLTRDEDPQNNPAMLLALMWHVAGDGQGAKDMVVLPYKDRLMLFSRYLQQLVMESLGKEKDLGGNIVHQGIAVYGNKGSTDQHAYVQQLRDGLNNFFATFIEVLRDQTPMSAEGASLEVEPGITSGDYLNGFYLGTRAALYENERDSITITIEELNAGSLGSLIALYERAVGFYASLVGINAYHQPGVEAGKKAAARVIELQTMAVEALRNCNSDDGMSAQEIADSISASDEAETVYRVLEHLASNPGSVDRLGETHPIAARYRMTS